MSGKTVAAKLGIKPGFSVRLIAQPADYESLLEPMPADVTTHTGGDGPFDAVIVFIPSTATLTTHSAKAVRMLKPDGMLWLAYPKKTGAIASDMSRETAWAAFTAEKFLPVSQIAIDDTWSALRFRPASSVKSTRWPA